MSGSPVILLSLRTALCKMRGLPRGTCHEGLATRNGSYAVKTNRKFGRTMLFSRLKRGDNDLGCRVVKLAPLHGGRAKPMMAHGWLQ